MIWRHICDLQAEKILSPRHAAVNIRPKTFLATGNYLKKCLSKIQILLCDELQRKMMLVTQILFSVFFWKKMPTIVASTKIMVLNVVAIISNLVPKTDFDFFQSDSVSWLARWSMVSKFQLRGRKIYWEGWRSEKARLVFRHFQSKANFFDD